MSGQDRTAIGARLTERLLQRNRSRQRVSLSDLLLARVGGLDALAGGLLTDPAQGDADGDLVFLSIRPYIARMRRLAMARRRREQRLDRFTQRAAGHLRTSAWKRWPGAVARKSPALPWGGLGVDVLGTSDMHLPQPAVPAAVEAEVEPAAAVAPRRKRGSTARLSASPWLNTPWTGARVAHGRSEAAASTARVAETRTGGRALDRVGARLAATPSSSDPLVRSIEKASPLLARSSRGRRLQQELVELIDLPAEERAVRIKRVLRRVAATNRTVVEEVEAAVPQARPRAASLARRRLAQTAGGRSAGLRPVLSGSPAMRAVQPAPVDTAGVADSDQPQQSPRAARPVAVAASRSRSRAGAWLSTSPVRKAAVAATRQALSASPVSRGRVTQATARARTAQAVSAARARTPSTPRRRSGTGSTPRATRSATPRAGPDEGPPPGPAGGDDASAGLAPPPSDGGPRSAATQPAPSQAPHTDLAAQQLTDRQWLELGRAPQPLVSRSARATGRVFERLELVEEPWAEEDAQEAVLDRVLASADRTRARSGSAVVRSPRGVYVPARTLAAPDRAPQSDVEAPDLQAPSAAPRTRSTPTPAQRATYVSPVASSARVATRTSPSRHAAARAQAQPRAGSVLPRLVHSPADAPRGSSGRTLSARRRASPARSLGLQRDASGTFVAQRASAAQPTQPDSGRPAQPAQPAQPNSGRPAQPSAQDASPASWAQARLPTARAAAASRRLSLRSPVVTPLVAAAQIQPQAADSTPRLARATRSQLVAASDRSDRLPVVSQSSRRAATPHAAASSSATASADKPRVLAELRTRHRPSPVAYARRYGLPSPSQVIVQTVDVPSTADGDATTTGAPPAVSQSPSTARRAPGALDRLDLRAMATSAWVLDAHGLPAPQTAVRGSQRRPAAWQWSPDGVVLAPSVPVVEDRTEDAPDQPGVAPASAWAGARVARTAAGIYVPGDRTGAPPPTRWAGDRSRRSPSSRRGPAARAARPAKGRFDATGVYRSPLRSTLRSTLAAERRGATAATLGYGAPSTVPVQGLAAPQPDYVTDDQPTFHPGMPGVAAPLTVAGAAGRAAPRSRPDLALTLGAVDVGVDDPRLPTWARRSSGEPLIHREDRFIDALARASAPEDVVRIIYERAERGGLSPSSSGLPAPVIQVIEQIRSVASAVSSADAGGSSASGSLRAGPGSDSEVVRRSLGTRAPSRSTARVARGFSSLRGRGTASSRDGVGADKLSKLSKRLQGLILLAERQRNQARQEVRMAEDSAAARAEGQSSPGAAEGGNDRKIDIEALGREVLEVVSMELEMRKQRSQEGSDEYGWW